MKMETKSAATVFQDTMELVVMLVLLVTMVNQRSIMIIANLATVLEILIPTRLDPVIQLAENVDTV